MRWAGSKPAPTLLQVGYLLLHTQIDKVSKRLAFSIAESIPLSGIVPVKGNCAIMLHGYTSIKKKKMTPWWYLNKIVLCLYPYILGSHKTTDNFHKTREIWKCTFSPNVVNFKALVHLFGLDLR